ncbi:hypothetical protein SAY86_005286 [Trapa natans]|uniref:Glycosyltransferase n=1 Tax=Trapa natans TaxID=22666 RepID=A0AAN7QVD1_TRANT|nr:hypothetical protein SAY86_005286 [Trapa natans]
MEDMARSADYESLHFVLLPHLAQGHLIPMMDMARLIARRGPSVTVITTPLNAARSRSTVDRAARSGLRICLLEVPFPSSEAGLPLGCESMDSLPSRSLFKNLLIGIRMLQKPVEEILLRLEPKPSCLISDKNVMWANETAGKLGIPRIAFDGTSCFSLLCTHRIIESKAYETVPEGDPFVVPGLPDQIELTRAQLPGAVNIGGPSDMKEIRDDIRLKELAAYGVISNTFEELEPAYVEGFRKVRGKVWCIGPMSIVNEHRLDKAERGESAAMGADKCLSWLDLWGSNSVIYACLGSMSRPSRPQLIELGLGLEASKRPFIWAVRDGYKTEEFDCWMKESGFEDRIKGRGLLIRGWAPQVLILSHPAIGGFVTHCGWNSTLEGVCAGVPMVAWPMFAEQFYNEKMIVQVLGIGVSLGSAVAIKWGEEGKFGKVVKKEMVEKVIAELMGEREDAQARRRRAMVVGEKAKKAMEEGGSSYLNLTAFIEDIRQQTPRH